MFSHKFNNKNYHINKLYFNWKTVMLLNLCTQIRLSSFWFIMWFGKLKSDFICVCVAHAMYILIDKKENNSNRAKNEQSRTANGFYLYTYLFNIKWYIVLDNDVEVERVKRQKCFINSFLVHEDYFFFLIHSGLSFRARRDWNMKQNREKKWKRQRDVQTCSS